MLKKWMRRWLGIEETDRVLALYLKKQVKKPLDSPVIDAPIAKGYDGSVRRPTGGQ